MATDDFKSLILEQHAKKKAEYEEWLGVVKVRYGSMSCPREERMWGSRVTWYGPCEMKGLGGEPVWEKSVKDAAG